MSIDLNGALSSPSLGFKYYINYYYQGNSLNITPAEIGEIKATYVDKLNVWKNFVENNKDINIYEIDADDYDDAVEWGEEHAKEISGYENTGGQRFVQGGRTAGSVVTALGAPVAETVFADGLTEVGIGMLGSKCVEKGALKACEKAGEKCLEESGKQAAAVAAGEEAIGSIGIIISCALDLVIAGLPRINKPNKTQKEAVDAYNKEMSEQLSNTEQVQYDIADIDTELQNFADEANQVVEDANQQMGENKVQYDFNRDTIEYFEADRTSGYQFTAEDVDAYNKAVEFMQQTGVNITTTRDDSSEKVNELHDEMASKEADFDTALETIGNVEGFTTEVASVDKTTQTQCYIEGGVATLNGLVATAHGIEAGALAVSTGWCGLGFAYGLAAAAAVGAAVMDGLTAAEQFEWAGQIGDEIDLRKNTQDTNSTSRTAFDDGVDYYEGYMTDVESLELAVPEDVEPPTETAPPVASGAPPQEGNNGSDNGSNNGDNNPYRRNRTQ